MFDVLYIVFLFFEELFCDFFFLLRILFILFVGGNWYLFNNFSFEVFLLILFSLVGFRVGVWRGEFGGEYCEYEFFFLVSELVIIDMVDFVIYIKRFEELFMLVKY